MRAVEIEAERKKQVDRARAPFALKHTSHLNINSAKKNQEIESCVCASDLMNIRARTVPAVLHQYVCFIHTQVFCSY